MPVKVIDASALVAVLFEEPDSGSVLSRVGRNSLVAPHLIEFEVASACLKKIRAQPGRRDGYFAIFQLMRRVSIEMAHVDLTEVIPLAEEAGLTVYDACYLWLARAFKCELLTLDKRLAAASKR